MGLFQTPGEEQRPLLLERRECSVCVGGGGGGGVFSFQSAVHDNLGMLPNQIWVCSPVNSKANLVKGSTAFASRTKQREQAVHAQKIPTPPH